MNESGERVIFPTVDFLGGRIRLIDQTLLPVEERSIVVSTVDMLVEAIERLRVRGAPAIGMAAAYGVLLALELELEKASGNPSHRFFDRKSGVDPGSGPLPGVEVLQLALRPVRERLARTRPTAVNLFWALGRMEAAIEAGGRDPVRFIGAVAGEAFRIHAEELELEIMIGEHGAPLIENGMGVLTHCNAGGLATAGYGTALAVIRRAHELGRSFTVFADETRPLLQGARLTAWELLRSGIGVTVLCDGAAASLLAAGRVDMVVVGADRIARNGDTANKIGTLGLAVLCARYGKPLYVAAPLSTFDLGIESGREIPIEERAKEEVLCFQGITTAPAGAEAYNPAFDVTPAGLIAGIITERGVIHRPDPDGIAAVCGSRGT